MYLIKLCENIQTEKEQGEFVFEKLFLNELLKQDNSTSESTNNSLKNTTIAWFIQATSTTKDSKLYTNQLLILLLRCLNSFPDVRIYCATIDYIEELLHLYRNSQNNITILLSLKILRNLILLLPENATSKTMIKNFFEEILYSISASDKLTPEIITEFIYIYRTVMSIPSSWQILATQLVFDAILSNSN